MASRPAPPGRKASTQGTTAQRVAAREGEGDDAPPPADDNPFGNPFGGDEPDDAVDAAPAGASSAFDGDDDDDPFASGFDEPAAAAAAAPPPRPVSLLSATSSLLSSGSDHLFEDEPLVQVFWPHRPTAMSFWLCSKDMEVISEDR